jgi:hypothetical protein
MVHVSLAVTIITSVVTTSTTTTTTAAIITIKAKTYETKYYSLYTNVILN